MANFSNLAYCAPVLGDALPSYALFGESPETGFSAGFHVERTSSRIALHNGTVEPHRHPHLHQLTYWVSGAGEYVLEDQRHPVSPGLLCWIPAGRIHGFSVEPGSDAIVISLAREHAEAQLASIELGHGAQVFLHPCLVECGPGLPDGLEVLFARAERDYAGSGWGCQETVGALAGLIFISIGRHLAEQGRLMAGSMLKTPLFQKLQTCVEQRFKDHPSVSDLAAEIGTTPYLLNKACHAATGLHVSKFVRRRIVREVERLLLFTELDMAQVAELTGFSDPSHFTRTFKALRGETPKVWRARAQSGSEAHEGSR